MRIVKKYRFAVQEWIYFIKEAALPVYPLPSPITCLVLLAANANVCKIRQILANS